MLPSAPQTPVDTAAVACLRMTFTPRWVGATAVSKCASITNDTGHQLVAASHK